MKKTCLLLGEINFKSLENKDLSQEFRLAFTTVLDELGYLSPTYLSHEYILGRNSHNFIKHLIEDDLVVANLTDQRPSVYYQLSIRHFLEKPIIHIISNETALFDVSDPRFYYIHIDAFHDFETIKQELMSKIASFDDTKKYGLQYMDFIRKAEKPYGEFFEKIQLLLDEKDAIRVNEIEEKDEYRNLNISTFVERRLAKNELVRRQKQ